MIAGLAYAQEPPITLTTDKALYHPGDPVYVTVTANNPIACTIAYQLYMLCLRIVMTPVPLPVCGYSCPTTGATLLLRFPAYNPNGFTGGYQGKAVLHVPDNTPAGHYDLRILTCVKWVINGNQIGCGDQYVLYEPATVGITIAGQTATP